MGVKVPYKINPEIKFYIDRASAVSLQQGAYYETKPYAWFGSICAI